MTTTDANIETIRAALAPHGILVRGVLGLEDGELARKDGWPLKTIVLLGNAGGSIWPSFSAWREKNRQCDNPLDRWSMEVIAPVAENVGGVAFFPSERPWQPFQQWATRAEGLKASPLGILIHPEYGLWHGYRGAIGLSGRVDRAQKGPALSHPCDECLTKPCMNSCPAGAISEAGFAYGPCRSFLSSEDGKKSCMTSGCLARNACPVGAVYRYPAQQLQFHMQALSLPV